MATDHQFNSNKKYCLNIKYRFFQYFCSNKKIKKKYFFVYFDHVNSIFEMILLLLFFLILSKNSLINKNISGQIFMVDSVYKRSEFFKNKNFKSAL